MWILDVFFLQIFHRLKAFKMKIQKKSLKLYKFSTSAVSIIAGPNLCSSVQLSLVCLQNH